MAEPTEGPNRFLLYIDILGFREMTLSEPRKVARVYAILDKLNVHKHPNFKTIVFSDTILTYNPDEVTTDDDRRYLVWYLTEFAEDLHHRLIGQDVWFRAVLVAGDFNHYRLDHVECFFGRALIDAYLAEKGLPLTGLAMHRSCQPYNRFFRLEEFSANFSFVYLCRQLEVLKPYAADGLPFNDWAVSDMAPNMPEAVRFLRDLYTHMRSHPDPSVRAKTLTTWDFYNRRYPEIISALLAKDFDLSALGPTGAWEKEAQVLEQNIRYYRRIGSGTPISLSLTGRARDESRLKSENKRKARARG